MRAQRLRFDMRPPRSYHFALMSAPLPPVLDAWRMVAAKRLFEGRLPLSGMTRLLPALADADGECRFEMEFGRDAMDLRYVELRIEADRVSLRAAQGALEILTFAKVQP